MVAGKENFVGRKLGQLVGYSVFPTLYREGNISAPTDNSCWWLKIVKNLLKQTARPHALSKSSHFN